MDGKPYTEQQFIDGQPVMMEQQPLMGQGQYQQPMMA